MELAGYATVISFAKHQTFEKMKQDDFGIHVVSDLAKVAGYFPGIGTIVGIARLVLTISTGIRLANENKLNQRDFIFLLLYGGRSVAEITSCLGIGLVIIDVVATVVFSTKAYQKQPT